MTTAVLPDVDLDVLLDAEVPCEAIENQGEPDEQRCSEAAGWLLRSVCVCGHGGRDLLCRRHKDMILALYATPAIEFTCGKCGRHDVRITSVDAL